MQRHLAETSSKNLNFIKKTKTVRLPIVILSIGLWIAFSTKISYFIFFGFEPLLFYALLVNAMLQMRLILTFKYHGENSISGVKGSYPKISFCIVGYNEEDAIYQTIRYVSKIKYPKDRFEIIVVNDGSTDRTKKHIDHAVKRFRSIKIHPIHFKKNKGKREGMYAAYKKSKSEFLFYVDSDTFLDRHALNEALVRFRDGKTAAIACMALVANQDTNVITKMQAIRYYNAFSIVKASESALDTILCCSGCSSIYRRSALAEIMDSWRNQTFMGKRCTFGDDRSLTNHLLRAGYDTGYSNSAIAYTNVPDSYRKYSRQQLRWKKSWTIESIEALKFMHRRHVLSALSFYITVLSTLLAPIVVVYIFMRSAFVTWEALPLYLLGVALVSVAYGAYYALGTGNRHFLRGSIMFVLVNISLLWQIPWAAKTLNNRDWGTR